MTSPPRNHPPRKGKAKLTPCPDCGFPCGRGKGKFGLARHGCVTVAPMEPSPRGQRLSPTPRPQPDEMARAITSWMRLDDNDRALVLARLRRAWADEDTKDGRDALCVADYLLRAAEKAGKP